MIGADAYRDKKIVIFGTGSAAMQMLFYLEQKGIKVMYLLNNKRCISHIHGYDVFEPDEEHVKGTFIIVAAQMESYISMAKQLKGMGLKEFENYIFYEWIFKKIALLHGNCHLSIIKKYISSCSEFSDAYSIYPNPLIHENKEKEIDAAVLGHTDLYIHQDIKDDNGYSYKLSDTYMKTFVNPNAKEIVIPNLFGLGKGFFSQASSNSRNEWIANGNDTNGMFPHADSFIDSCVEKGMTKDEVISFCLDNKSGDHDRIRKNFNLFLQKIKLRQTYWDVPIVEFVEDNYRNIKLFYDEGHPTNSVLRVIAIGILNKLNIYDDNIYSDECLDNHELPIYPAVKEALHLEFQDDLLRKSSNSKKMCSKMDIEEYIIEYLWWCWKI